MNPLASLQNRFRDLPIKWKVMVVTCTASLVAILAVAGGLYLFQVRNFRETHRRELAALAAIMADNCATPLTIHDPRTAAAVLAPLHVKPDIKNAGVLAADGQEFASFGGDDECPPPPPGAPAGVIDRGGTWTVVQPILLDGTRLGTFFMDVDFAGPRAALQRVYLGVTAAVLGGSLALVALLTMQLQEFIVRPIRLLAAASAAVARDHDFSVRVDARGTDELGHLTRAFNDMLGQFQAQDTALQGAQHKLRQQVNALQREVGERKRAEAAQARLAAILEGTSDFVSSASPMGRAFYLNRAAREMVGLGPDEDFSMMTMSDFHPGWAARIVSTEGLPGAIHDGSWTGETALRHRDGREIHVSQVIIAHKHENGAVEYFSTVMRDITGQRQAAQALRMAEAKFRGLVEQLPAITYHATLGETCSWSYVSPQITSLLGFTTGEWLASDRLWFEHIHPDDRAIPIAAEAVAERTGSFLAEYRMFTRHGELRWFRDQAVFVPEAEEKRCALYGVMMDITEAKAAEAQLAQLNVQLLETSRAAGMAEVATGVLHNVGNVLNSVNVSASLVLEKLRRSKAPNLAKAAALLAGQNGSLAHFLTTDPDGRKLPGYLAKLGEYFIAENTALLREVGQLGQNIEHIKEIVAMQQSYAKVSGAFENLPLDRLVEDALGMHAGSFERHGIVIERRFRPAPLARVDRHKVLQILVNLLSNARQALDETARPDKRIAIAIEPAGACVRIAVADNGIGIPPENLARIFGHGFTTKQTGHGFGLHSGALAAKEIGGTLTVSSPGPGRGATFTLSLPAAPPRP